MYPVSVIQIGCFILLSAVVTLDGGCNRAAARIPCASLPFRDTPTRYEAQTCYPFRIVVLPPVDMRRAHYGEHVAGARWTACSTDTLLSGEASTLIQNRLVDELRASHLFTSVGRTPTYPDDVLMRTEIHAFCSQVVGIVFARVAGISVLRTTLEHNGTVFLDRRFERVVTDADPEYSGLQVTFIEQAMRVTMADSLREVIKDMLIQFEAEYSVFPKMQANHHNVLE